jgi:hypothetical protein
VIPIAVIRRCRSGDPEIRSGDPAILIGVISAGL